MARSLCKLPTRGLKKQGQTTRPSVHGRMQETNTATPVSCEPAQSKCTWTCHKNHLVWKFTREMPDASPAAIVLSLRSRHGHGHVTSHFVLKFTGNWPHTDATISIQYRDLTVTVRTPQCGHTVWGEKKRAVNEVLPKPSKAYNGNRIKNVYQQPVALLVPDRHKPLPLKGLSTDWLDSTGRCF